jgi:hypothetical protein
MEGPWLSTTGKRRGKKKFRNAGSANTARKNAEAWQALLDKWGVKDEVKTTKIQRPTRFDPVVRNSPVVDPKRLTHNIPSVDTGASVAAKKPVQQYTGDAMIGIGVLHKSNSVPIFSKQDATDISKMRRG